VQQQQRQEHVRSAFHHPGVNRRDKKALQNRTAGCSPPHRLLSDTPEVSGGRLKHSAAERQCQSLQKWCLKHSFQRHKQPVRQPVTPLPGRRHNGTCTVRRRSAPHRKQQGKYTKRRCWRPPASASHRRVWCGRQRKRRIPQMPPQTVPPLHTVYRKSAQDHEYNGRTLYTSHRNTSHQTEEVVERQSLFSSEDIPPCSPSSTGLLEAERWR